MIHRFYEWHLTRKLMTLPEKICFMIAEQDMEDVPEKICEVTSWCRDLSINSVIFHISTSRPTISENYLDEIRILATIAHLTLLYGDMKEVLGTGIDVTVAVGLSGREEITRCIRSMGHAHVDPDTVTEEMIESYLTFPYEPDLVIKTGGDHLTDFLIWQSVYSELFFSDVNWNYFRKVDFLRALRDYQFRKRRFGK
ncbi:MAG: di-trans,poly-cis-decaprenylcistransferase [Methanoculleus sp. SDB]|nr:MAG: di-trans,poly-cis-decaprenylcistransferase [Methanoculleus sp. SDB]